MTNDGSSRLPPLPDGEWDPLLDGVRGELRTVLNVHRVMAHHPALLEAWTPLRNHIVTGGSLSGRHRELVILRVAHRAGSDYEWHHHEARAQEAGLTIDEIEAVRTPSPTGASGDETVLLMATDELFDGLTISDSTWGSLTAAFSVRAVLDLIVTVGVYVTLAMVIGATGLPIES